jgi:putative photosynthetic complex assembly protein 2
MSDLGWACGLALLSWWLSTGVILYLNHLPRATHRWSLAVASILLAVCLYLLPGVSGAPSRGGAAAGFLLALVIWGWLEMSYLMGFVTGPRSAPCPQGATGGKRFRLAIQTSLYHELAVVGTAAAIISLTWGNPNQVASWTFLVLWLMRWSAKLNLFLGVVNYNQEWLPEHLHYLGSYTRRRSMNLLFPLSVGLGTVVATALITHGLHGVDQFERSSHALVGALLALAVLEHWFLMLPLRDSALWQWALRKKPDNLSTKSEGSKRRCRDSSECAASTG